MQVSTQECRDSVTRLQGFHEFRGRGGSFEVFYNQRKDGEDPGGVPLGWYWWPCFPGCLPDGEAAGPFRTSREAFDDAQG